MRIETTDTEGMGNGYIDPIWNVNERPDLRPDQIYVTSVNGYCKKGPHLHMQRRGFFRCILGKVRIVTFQNNQYLIHELSARGGESLVVPPGVPAGIFNPWRYPAVLINMPAPAWSKEEPDDHKVEGWVDPPGIWATIDPLPACGGLKS